MDALAPNSLKLGREIGTGAFFVVYEGELNGNPVAIKQLHPLRVAEYGQHFRDIVRRVGLLLKKLSHPHIVKFIELYDSKELGLVLIMERMHHNLNKYLKLHAGAGKLSRERQIDICLQIADAVRYLHSQHPPVVCRDLSRLNVYLSLDGTLKLGPSVAASRLPSCGYFDEKTTGPISYMPPEVGNAHYKENIDIFSFGVLMLEIATLRLALLERAGFGTVSEVNHRAADLSLLPEDHPLKPIILQCLRDDPEERPNSGAVFRMLSEGEAITTCSKLW